MNSFEDNNLKRIADALDRLIPSPINLQNLNSSNLFIWKTNPDQLIDLGWFSTQINLNYSNFLSL